MATYSSTTLDTYLSSPRVFLALLAADDVLLMRPTTDFPFNAQDFAVCYPNVRFISLDIFPPNIRIQLSDEEAFCVPGEHIGIPYDLIFVNSSRAISQRVLWSIAHELGHLSLYHFHDFNVSYLDEALEDDPYAKRTQKMLEREADIFATELLMPYAIIKHLKMTVPEITYFFHVSRQAARLRWEEVQHQKYAKILSKQADDIVAKYEDFIGLVEFERYLATRSTFEIKLPDPDQPT